MYSILLSIDFIFYFIGLIYLCNLLLTLCMRSFLWVSSSTNWNFIMTMVCVKKDWINYFLIFISLSLPPWAFYISKVHQIFAWNIFSGVSSYDIMWNCDIMDSPFSENMASLKRLLILNRKSKHERKVNFLL